MGSEIVKLNANLATLQAIATSTDGGKAITPAEAQDILKAAGGSAHYKTAMDALKSVAGYSDALALKTLFPHLRTGKQDQLLQSDKLSAHEKAALVSRLEPNQAAERLQKLPAEEQVAILDAMSPSKMKMVVALYDSDAASPLFAEDLIGRAHGYIYDAMDVDSRAALVLEMHPDDVAKLLPELPGSQSAEILNHLPMKAERRGAVPAYEEVIKKLEKNGQLRTVFDAVEREHPKTAERMMLLS